MRAPALRARTFEGGLALMLRIRNILCACFLAAALGPGIPSRAGAQELIVNGGLESGDFTGWTRVDRPLGAPYDPSVPAAGAFVIDDADGQTPLSDLSALGPAAGAFYALSDMTAQGTHTLLQSFTVPLGAQSVNLSFDMVVYDWFGGGAFVSPAGLDHTTPDANQHARVDLLDSGASAFDTGAGVVANFYLGVDPEAAAGQAPIYRHYAFDLTPLALPGGTYQLRLGVVDNLFVLNQGVDNVSLVSRAAPAAVPEPSARVLVVLGMVALAFVRPRRGRIDRQSERKISR